MFCIFDEIRVELYKTERWFGKAQRIAHLGSWELNLQSKIMYLSDGLFKIFEINPQQNDLSYKPFLNTIHPDEQEKINDVYTQHFRERNSYDIVYRLLMPDGRIKYVQEQCESFSNDTGTQIRSEGIVQDLTSLKEAELELYQTAQALEKLMTQLEQRVQERTEQLQKTETCYRTLMDHATAEDALRESKLFLQTVLDTFPLSVFWKDRDSVYLGCNRNFLQNAGLTSIADVIGKTDYDMPWGNTEADAYRTDDKQVMDSNTPKLGIIETLLHTNGKTVWLETNKLPLHDLDGNVIGVLGTYQDITKRKQAEEQLQRTNTELIQATRLKDQFLANMSHELRTPLNAIMGLTESLQGEIFGFVNERQSKALHTIENSANHLLMVINDILDITKIESGQIELERTSISLENLCSSSMAFINSQALRKSIQLEINLSPNLPNLLVDEQRIHQVLINLLTNAVKFTNPRGKITLAVSPSEDIAQPNYLRISVIDTGIGIAPENINKVFQPFVQIDGALNRKYEGTGLGLALVKQIVELHGGQVVVTSELGVGSCFSIYLPYEEATSD